MERTNFYDAVYSPVVLILNAIVVACVMLLSASGSPRVLTLFGMSAGTAVAVMNYISQIFTPVEGLGMEIQTIQSAVAGIRRMGNEFLSIVGASGKRRTSREKGRSFRRKYRYRKETDFRSKGKKMERRSWNSGM